MCLGNRLLFIQEILTKALLCANVMLGARIHRQDEIYTHQGCIRVNRSDYNPM